MLLGPDLGGCRYDYSDVTGSRIGGEFVHDCVSIELRHLQVEDDHVRAAIAGLQKPIHAVGSLDHLIGRMADQMPHHVAEGLLVVDDEHASTCVPGIAWFKASPFGRWENPESRRDR